MVVHGNYDIVANITKGEEEGAADYNPWLAEMIVGIWNKTIIIFWLGKCVV